MTAKIKVRRASEAKQAAIPPVSAPIASTTKGKPGRETPIARNGDSSLVMQARDGLGVTQEVFARMIGVSSRSVAGWEAGRPIQEASRRRIREMTRLAASLREVMRPQFVPQWLMRPNDELRGLSPIQVLEHGETDRLWRSVFLLGSGLPI